jgi:hypothetical protein
LRRRIGPDASARVQMERIMTHLDKIGVLLSSLERARRASNAARLNPPGPR